MTTWWKYAQELIGEDSRIAAARKAGFDKSAFTRWEGGANADPAFVVKLARAYEGNVLHALVASGLITEEEAQTKTVTVGKMEALQEATDGELVGEVLRRLEAASDAHPAFTEPVSEANVTMLHAAKEAYPPNLETD